MAAQAIRVDNLQEVRKALRGVDKDALKAVQAVTKHGAQIVATEASALAPRRTGRLAASIKATTSGARGIVRSRLPYAAVHEFGGTIRPHGPNRERITIKRSEFVGRALENKRDEVLDELARGFDRVARENGW